MEHADYTDRTFKSIVECFDNIAICYGQIEGFRFCIKELIFVSNNLPWLKG